jgi:NAD(P)H dehydrogenase (quinone)
MNSKANNNSNDTKLTKERIVFMNYLIISSHPYDGSFNAGVAKTAKEILEQKGHKVEHIDLVADGFDPVMRGEDLRMWGKGQSVEPNVPKYKEAIERADILIFPIPSWWSTMPAILKGFCDKVLLPGWAYTVGENGQLIGQLAKKAIIVSTMQTPESFYINYFNNPIYGSFVKDTLQTCGIETIKHFIFDNMSTGGREHAEGKMEEFADYLKQQ